MSEITEIKNSSHQHHLELKCIQTCHDCDGCKELVFGSCYKCKKRCDYHLHKECAILDFGSITHPFFKKSHFTFHESPSGPSQTSSCVACGKKVQGFMYKSSSNDAHVLHPCCFKLPHNKTTENHGVINLLEKLPFMSKSCLKCGKKNISNEIKGWAYVSACGKYRYHVACVKDMVVENWNNVRFLQQSEGRNKSTVEFIVQQITAVLTGKKVRKYSWTIIKSIVELIISAIFGDSTSIILTLADSLQN